MVDKAESNPGAAKRPDPRIRADLEAMRQISKIIDFQCSSDLLTLEKNVII